MTPTLETPRLLLSPLALADAEQIQRIFPQWEIVRYLAARVPWPYPPDGADKFIRDIVLPAMERGEAWHWTLRLKTEPAQIIGSIDLRAKENDNRGFWLGLRWQGQGLMSEASEAVTDFWFETLKFPVLRAPKAIQNVASRRISERQGMRMVGVEERDYVSGRFPTEIWETTAEEWRARKLHSGKDA
jgi:[ribosomal protein S5]-alanine N-acetyltransferase